MPVSWLQLAVPARTSSDPRFCFLIMPDSPAKLLGFPLSRCTHCAQGWRLKPGPARQPRYPPPPRTDLFPRQPREAGSAFTSGPVLPPAGTITPLPAVEGRARLAQGSRLGNTLQLFSRHAWSGDSLALTRSHKRFIINQSTRKTFLFSF